MKLLEFILSGVVCLLLVPVSVLCAEVLVALTHRARSAQSTRERLRAYQDRWFEGSARA